MKIIQLCKISLSNQKSTKIRLIYLLMVILVASGAQHGKAQSQWDGIKDDAQNIISGMAHAGKESPALPLMTLLRESPELICNSWKISGFVMLRNMALADGDPANMEKLWKLNARIEAACDEEHFTTGPPTPPTGGVTGGKGTNPPPPPPPPTPAEMADAVCAHQCKGAYDAWMEALEAQTNAGMNYFGSHSAADLADYKAAITSSQNAKAAYYACVKRCYDSAVGAGVIPAVPGWVTSYIPPAETPKQPASQPVKQVAPKVEEGSNFKSVTPAPGGPALKTETSYLPPIAGPGSTIIGTVTDSSDSGTGGFIVGTVDDAGNKKFFQSTTGKVGTAIFVVGAGVTSVELFKHFDEKGNPVNPATTTVGDTPHLPGSEPLPQEQIPSHGPMITEGNTVIDDGAESHGRFQLHTRGTNPLTTKVLLDNREIKILAASDSSVTAQVPDDTTLGVHQVSVSSDGVASNAFSSDIVKIQADPIPPLHRGAKAAVVVHVEGIPAKQKAMMHFEVSGAAQLKGGEASTDVAVKDGIAKVEIEGVQAGTLRVKYQVTIPDLWKGK